MKKIFFPILFVSALLLSCGDDDDESSNPSGNKQETVDNTVTKDNCLDALKKNYGIDLQLPSSSSIAMYSEISYKWCVTVMSSGSNNDGLEVAKALFSLTKSISTDGLFDGEFIVDQQSNNRSFVRESYLVDLDDANQSQYDGYAEYGWYYHSENGSLVQVYIENDEMKGIYKIAFN